MARIIRVGLDNLTSAQGTAKTHTFGTTTGQYTTLDQNLRPPSGQYAKVAKWSIIKQTVGTGTTLVTAYLVAPGGTSSTRQISDPIVIDIDATAPTYQEAGGNDAYVLSSVTDFMDPPDINFTSSTTATNAPTGMRIGIIWSL